MIRRPPRSTPLYSSAASDVYKRQTPNGTKHGNAYGSSRKHPVAEQHRNEDGLSRRPPVNEENRVRTVVGSVFVQVRETLRQMMPSASRLSIFAVFVGVCMNKPLNERIISSDGTKSSSYTVSYACVEKTKRLFAEFGKCREGLKCFRQNEEFDVGTSSSVVVSSKERSVKTPEVDAEEGESSSSESLSLIHI